jgi:hypothetical protein
MHLDVSTMRPLAERRHPDGAPPGVGAGSSLAFLRTCIDDISLLLYARLARAGARPHALNRGLLCSAIGVRDEAFRQRHSCIGVIFTHSRVVCRSPFLRSSRSPRPLPRIANHRCAPPFPRILLQSALFADKRRGALLVRSFVKGSLDVSADVRIRVSFLPSILVCWSSASLRLIAARVRRCRWLIRARQSSQCQSQPKHIGNRSRRRWDLRRPARELAKHAARRWRSADVSRDTHAISVDEDGRALSCAAVVRPC